MSILLCLSAPIGQASAVELIDFDESTLSFGDGATLVITENENGETNIMQYFNDELVEAVFADTNAGGRNNLFGKLWASESKRLLRSFNLANWL
jgi:hypothetical protein